MRLVKLTTTRHLVAVAVAVAALGCRSSGPTAPFVLGTDEPLHSCARSGVSTCETECNLNEDGTACLVASIAYGQGRSVSLDRDKKQSYELRACELGSGQGCEHYANNFDHDDEAERKAALDYYERSCNTGWAPGCSALGSIALRVDARGNPSDPRTALEHLHTACEMGDAASCAREGDLRTLGIGTEMNPTVALRLYQKACDGHAPNGCHNAKNDPDLWLSIPLWVLFDLTHAPDPSFEVFEAPYGWQTTVNVRACVIRDSPEPIRVEVVESSGVREIDAVVVETIGAWRFEARPWLTSHRTFCGGFVLVFVVKQPGGGLLRLGRTGW